MIIGASPQAATGSTGPWTIGVVAPVLGGFYFGSLLSGVARGARRAGHRVVAVQTYPTRLPREKHPHEPLPGDVPALDAVDGLVVVGRALRPAVLDQLVRGERPVVLVGADGPELPVPVVLPDNVGAAHVLVEHLIGHGHTRIGFIGDPRQRDVRERYEGYCAALAEHGIEPDPEWFLQTDGNHEAEGVDAAERFLAGGAATTATVAATDLSALGFMSRLREEGAVLPRDHAVVGFDHVRNGSRVWPRLTTVDLHHDRVGEQALRRLLARLQGDVTTGVVRVPATSVVRESCGCEQVTTTALVDEPLVPEGDEPVSPGRARVERIARSAFAGPVPTLGRRWSDGEARAQWVRAVIEPLEIAAARGSGPSVPALRRLNDLTAALQPMPETIEQTVAAVREVEQEIAERLPEGSGRRAVLARTTTDVLVAVARGCTRPLLARPGNLERMLADQYEVDMDVLSMKGESPRLLTWLPGDGEGSACLGLWAGPSCPNGERELEVVGVRGASGALGRLVGRRVPAGQFPPAALARTDSTGVGITFVVPVRTPENDWGYLAVQGRVDAHLTFSRERYQHWAAMLAAALDHERVVAELREREEELLTKASQEHPLAEELRRLEERHAVWMAALPHGTWDWDVSAGTVYYSPQWKRALGYAPDEIGTSPTEWLDRVHPDDRKALSMLIAAQLNGAGTPLEIEHRVRAASGEYRWMLCRGATLLDDAGCPSRMVGALVDMTERKEQELGAARGSLRDPQSGLASRGLLLDALQSALDRAQRRPGFDAALVVVRAVDEPRTPVALVPTARDGGPGESTLAEPPAGPTVRRVAAAATTVLDDVLEHGDVVARLDGDEVAVLLGDVGERGEPGRVLAVVNALRAVCEEPLAVGLVPSVRAVGDAGAALRTARGTLLGDLAEQEGRRGVLPAGSSF